MKNEFKEFRKMMNAVGEDIVKNDKNVTIAYSSGLDSTAVMLSLLNANANITLMHMRHEQFPGWHEFFEESMAFYISKLFDLPILFIPFKKSDWVNFYLNFVKFGTKKLVTGDMMDFAYGEFYDENGKFYSAAFDEGSRAKHPIIEKFFKTAPMRLKVYKKNTYNERLQKVKSERFKELAEKKEFKKAGTEFIAFGSNPLFVKFFKNYKEDVKDIFFYKRLTKKYVNEYLKKYKGKTFRSLCKIVYNLNKEKYVSINERIIKYLEDGTLFKKIYGGR